MSTHRPEQAQHDVLLISIGTVAARAARAGMLMHNLGISAPDLVCRRFWLGIDTDQLEPWEPGPIEDRVEVRHVCTADMLGRSRTRQYLEKVVPGALRRFITDGLLPETLRLGDLSQRLIADVEQTEASKNPVKGFWFMISNLPRVLQALRELKSKMVAPNRTIVLVVSPSSGTAAGGWILTLALVMAMFPNTPPILVCVMPSRLAGRDEHVQRNRAIFGWNGRLLEFVVRHGLAVDWRIPVLGASPIHICLPGRHLAATYVVSARRRTGDVHLESTDELIHVLGQVLTLMIVGRGQGRGLPSAHSHVLNLTTDALLDEAEDAARVHRGAATPPSTDGDSSRRAPAQLVLPDLNPTATSLRPTRRFAAPGLFTVTLKAGLAAEVTCLGVRRAVESVVLDAVPSGADQQSLTNLLRRWSEERIAGYVRHFWFQVPDRAWARRSERGTELLEAIDDEVADFADAMRELVEVWEGDRLLHAELWRLIQGTSPGSLPVLPDLLRGLSIDEGQVLDIVASLPGGPAGTAPNSEETPVGALRRMADDFRGQAQLGTLNLRRLQQPAPPGRADLLRATIMEARLRSAILEAAATHLVPLLNRVREEYAERLHRLVTRLRAAEEADIESFARHEQVLQDESYLRADNYELGYRLAADRIARHASDAEALARGWLRSLGPTPDEALPDGEAIRRSLDRTVVAIEGITDFPADAGAVLRRLAQDADLLRVALARGRALVELAGDRYEARWNISHSALDSAEIQLACRDLQEAIRGALAGEEFGVTVNDGRLPLRDPADVLVVIQEQVVDFSIWETISDEPFDIYVEADERLSAGGGLTVHRLHGRLLRGALATPTVAPHGNGAGHRGGGHGGDARSGAVLDGEEA
jgi:hypothetical protein